MRGSIALTPEQAQIAAYSSGPLRIIAGAGSGKTEMMVTLVERLVHAGCASPGQVLALTFTERAAAELQGRIAGRLGPGPESTASTFHSFCAELLREFALEAGLDPDIRVLSRPAVWQMMFEVFDEFTFERVQLGNNVGKFIDQMVTLDSALKDNLVSPGDLHAYCRTFTDADTAAGLTAAQQLETIPVIRRYSERKRELNAIDYGDMIALAIELLAGNESVRADIHDRYLYILVDEFQDTNVAQKELIRLIAEPRNNLIVVGDPNQGIYAWRGATVSNILHFDDDYPGAVTRTLSVNFRCGSSIRRLADAIVRPLQGSYGWTFTSSSPDDQAAGMVSAIVTAHGSDEVEEIAGRIRAAHAGGTPYAEMAVLYRSGKQLPEIVSGLTAAEIPFEVVGGGQFYQRPEIIDALSALRLIARPHDDLALYRLLTGPRWRIGKRDLACLARLRTGGKDRRGIDCVLACDEIHDLSPEARDRCRRFGTEFRALARLAEEIPLSALVRHVLDRSGVLDELAASPAPSAAQARASLLHLVSIAREFENGVRSREPQLGPFIDLLDIVAQAGEDSEEVPPVTKDTVKVMTMHKAKGLQFDWVFLPGLAAREFPSDTVDNPTRNLAEVPYPLRAYAADLPNYQSDNFLRELDANHLVEERRLCYVAFTRARKHLVLSRAHYYRDNVNVRGPSLFWAEALNTGIPVIEREDDAPETNPRKDVEAPNTVVEAFIPTPIDPSPAHVRALVNDLSHDERFRFDDLAPRIRSQIEQLIVVENHLRPAAQPRIPDIQSVSALMTYETCPRRYYHEYIVPLPREIYRATLVGRDLHLRIEDILRGHEHTRHLAIEDDVDLHPSERIGVSPSPERMLSTFETSRFNRTPLMLEQPFTLRFQNGHVRGRIDAVYVTDDGVEVVDFKSGHPVGPTALDWLQLPLYALALNEVWGYEPSHLCYTYFFLQTGTEVQARASHDTIVLTRQRVERLLAAITERQFAARPDCACPVCRWIAR